MEGDVPVDTLDFLQWAGVAEKMKLPESEIYRNWLEGPIVVPAILRDIPCAELSAASTKFRQNGKRASATRSFRRHQHEGFDLERETEVPNNYTMTPFEPIEIEPNKLLREHACDCDRSALEWTQPAHDRAVR